MGQLVRSLAVRRKASVLFRTLKRVRVEYNPYDANSTTAREFLSRVRTAAVRKANADLQVELVPTESYGRAQILLNYVDGYEQTIDCSKVKIVDVMEEVERVARWRGVADPFGVLRAEREAKLATTSSG